MTKWVKIAASGEVGVVALQRPMIRVEETQEPEPGWIEVGDDVFAGFVGQEDGSFLAPETPSAEPPVPSVISRRQFYHGLSLAGKISQAEALAAVKAGAIPPALQVMIDGMTDAAAKFEVDMLLSGAAEFHRDHPLVMIIAITRAMSEDDVDDFWRMCAEL